MVSKSGYTAITPDVLELVAARGWTDLYITGMDTESCVLATALNAFEAGLTPWLVTDACASHAGPAAHEAGLLVTGRLIGIRQLISHTSLGACAQVK